MKPICQPKGRALEYCGIDMEVLCKRLGRNYYIKQDLRAEMEG